MTTAPVFSHRFCCAVRLSRRHSSIDPSPLLVNVFILEVATSQFSHHIFSFMVETDYLLHLPCGAICMKGIFSRSLFNAVSQITKLYFTISAFIQIWHAFLTKWICETKPAALVTFSPFSELWWTQPVFISSHPKKDPLCLANETLVQLMNHAIGLRTSRTSPLTNTMLHRQYWPSPDYSASLLTTFSFVLNTKSSYIVPLQYFTASIMWPFRQ